MKHRLVLACLIPPDVNLRACEEFDTFLVDGKNDMVEIEVVDASVSFRADAIMFTNTLLLNAETIA
jgi:hypothetical protein